VGGGRLCERIFLLRKTSTDREQKLADVVLPIIVLISVAFLALAFLA